MSILPFSDFIKKFEQDEKQPEPNIELMEENCKNICNQITEELLLIETKPSKIILIKIFSTSIYDIPTMNLLIENMQRICKENAYSHILTKLDGLSEKDGFRLSVLLHQ